MGRFGRNKRRLGSHGNKRFWVVLRAGVSTVCAVSFNRCEQALFDYVEKHPEERQFWLHKVRGSISTTAQIPAERLEIELWRYFLERAEVIPALKEFVRLNGKERTSLRNLAEYWLRLWSPPRKPASKGPEHLLEN